MRTGIAALFITGAPWLSTSPLVGEVDVRSTAGEGRPEVDGRACDQNIERGIFSSIALDLPTASEIPQLRRPLFRRYAPPSPTRGEGSSRLSTSPLVGEVDVRSTAGEGKPESGDLARDRSIECGIRPSIALETPADRETPQLRQPLFRRCAPPSPTRGEGIHSNSPRITDLYFPEAA